MATQKIILTAVPQGVQGANLRLFVHISPQLTGAPTLAGFPEWQSWPEALGKSKVKITISGIPAVTVTPKIDPTAIASWKALFKPSVKVDGYTFPNYNSRFIHSYPVANVLGHVKNVYQTIGVVAPETPPNADQMLGAIGLLIPPRVAPPKYSRLPGMKMPSNPREALKALQQYGREQRTIPPVTPGMTAAQQIQLDFFRSRLFHVAIPAATVPDKQTGQPIAKLNPIPEKQFIDGVDFHELVAMAGDHPLLLFRLGLAFEVVIPKSGAIPAGGSVMVEWAGPALPTATTFVSPKTMLVGVNFLAQPRAGGDVINGFLNLGERHELVSLDVDSAALKLAQFSEGLGVGERARTRGGSAPEPAPLAALRSAGISVVRTGRSVKLSTDLSRSAGMNTAANSGSPAPIYADDLIRGWRFDVRTVNAAGTPTSKWQSLCQRNGNYTLAGGPAFQGQDEGWVEMAVTEQPGNPGDIYLHESLARWNGWSLCVEPPGKPTPDRAVDGGAPFGVDTKFSPVPGSLPSLRFGKTYQLRARGADLTGGGVPLASDEVKFVSRPLTYLRYEPVPAPFLVFRTPGGEGETPENLVVRSFNDAATKDTIATTQAAERHAAPPRAAAQLCETHGVMDDASGRLRKDVYPLIVERHEPKADLEDRAGRVVAEADWILPYFPDPLAQRLTIQGLPLAAPGSREQITLDYGDAASWPRPKPIRLRLIEGTRGYRYDTATRVLEIRLPKGDKVNLKISTALKDDSLNLLQVWKWLVERMQKDQKLAGQLSTLTVKAQAGRLWMLTPQKEMTIVHAVQQPLKAPEITAIRASRPGNAPTIARFDGLISIHGKSTGVVDYTAAWEERRDEPGNPANNPVVDRAKQSASSFRLDLRFPNDEVPEVIDAPIVDNDNQLTALYQPSQNRIAFQITAPGLRAAAGNFPSMSFADTRYRRVNLTGRAATRFADYMFDRDDQPGKVLTRTAAPTVVDIPNGARPLAPQVLYAVPTFGWTRNATQSVRKGGGLRVYMDRPWFSSGDGEMLAVVLANPALTPGDARQNVVTLMGRDPIWPNTAVVNHPSAASFPKALRFNSLPDGASGPGVMPYAQCPTTGLSLEERADILVTVAPHAVSYDPDRRLWFCDIEVDTGRAYFPFIRLALARYQPRSMNGCHLSRVVLADVMPLVPDRTLGLVRSTTGLSVTLSGPAPMGALVGRGLGDQVPIASLSQAELVKLPTFGIPGVPLNLVEVQLEDAADGDTDLEWRALGNPVRLSSQGIMGGNATWNGSVPLPGATPGRPRRRLVIREYEGYRPDTGGGGTSSLRLCYIETVNL